MNGKAIIEEQIELFRKNNPFGDSLDHCFVPWYLAERFGINSTEAFKQSADTNSGYKSAGHDKNIDGFHLEKNENKITLSLIQGKRSLDLGYISEGVKGFTKSLQWLREILNNGINENTQENKVLRNLRAKIQMLGEDERKNITLEFIVIHLCELDRMSIVAKTHTVQKNLEQEIREEISTHNFRVYLEGPNEILNLQPSVKKASPTIEIFFKGINLEVADKNESKMFLGICNLSAIVRLYIERMDDLFSKNVRLFIKSKSNTEKGASAKIKETLKSICYNDSKMFEPTKFAFLHNGITIEARDVKLLENEKLSMRDPFVLNGCQTVVTSHLFKTLSKPEKLNLELWEQILVPIRVINSTDEKFIRQITTTTNRQNKITASALRANEPEQIKLEMDFKKIGIFYERQEGAFEYLGDNNPKLISQDYPNSELGQINIEDIARSLAAISGEIGIAKSVNDLFESDAAYERCFSKKRTQSKHFLVFLQNMFNVMTLVLQKDLCLDWKESKIKSGKIEYHIMCLLMRYFVKSKQVEFIKEYSVEIWGKNQYLREGLAKHLDNRHSGIKKEIKEKFMTMTDTSQSSINDTFRKIVNSLRLPETIDCFAPFENFDENFDE